MLTASMGKKRSWSNDQPAIQITITIEVFIMFKPFYKFRAKSDHSIEYDIPDELTSFFKEHIDTNGIPPKAQINEAESFIYFDNTDEIIKIDKAHSNILEWEIQKYEKDTLCNLADLDPELLSDLNMYKTIFGVDPEMFLESVDGDIVLKIPALDTIVKFEFE